MELTFLSVIIFVIPILAILFFLIKRSEAGNHTTERILGHRMYKYYRKSRMDKPVV